MKDHKGKDICGQNVFYKQEEVSGRKGKGGFQLLSGTSSNFNSEFPILNCHQFVKVGLKHTYGMYKVWLLIMNHGYAELIIVQTKKSEFDQI